MRAKYFDSARHAVRLSQRTKFTAVVYQAADAVYIRTGLDPVPVASYVVGRTSHNGVMWVFNYLLED